MTVTRRDLLALGGGAFAGIVFTPVPWKILDDTSIWTQNWKWIPQPARGPVEHKQTSCTLCPHGCGMDVRLAAGWPVGLSGRFGHPASLGALCPMAFGAHQLNWHPSRLRQVLHRGKPASWDEAVAAFRKACSDGKVAVIDGRGGRAVSSVYLRFAERQGGDYYAVQPAEEQALRPYQEWSGISTGELGFDLESARTIVSFGAPLLDGWGGPGRFPRIWSEHSAGLEAPPVRLIQLESELSRTGSCSWMRIEHAGGSAAFLAAALAHVLIEERLVAARSPKPAIPFEEAVQHAGIPEATVRRLARAMVERGPVLAVSAAYEPAVAALNLLLDGGIVQRGTGKPVRAVEELAGSPRAVLIDSATPWDVQPETDAEVFRFAAWKGADTRSDWLLPAFGFQEELSDVPAAPGAAFETYTIAPPLLAAAQGAMGTAQFLATAGSDCGTVEDAIHVRCEELFAARHGELRLAAGGEPVPVKSIESAGKLREQLSAGAVWVADSARKPLRCEIRQWPTTSGRQPAADWAVAWRPAVLPPLAAKMFRETNLREVPARARI